MRGKASGKSFTMFSPLKRDTHMYREVGTMCLGTCDTEQDSTKGVNVQLHVQFG